MIIWRRVRYHRYRGSGQSGGDQSQERRTWSIWGWQNGKGSGASGGQTSTGAAFLPTGRDGEAFLTEEEKKMVKGLVINKFRGDKSILDPGIEMLEELAHIPVVGVAPYMQLELDDEDSLTERFHGSQEAALVDIAVIRVPRISNFTV